MPLLGSLEAIKRKVSGVRAIALALLLLLVTSAIGYKLVPRVYNARKLAQLSGRKVYDETADSQAQLVTAFARAKREQKPVLVILGGNWCQWCLTLDSLLESDRELHELVTRKFVLLKLDADSASELDERWGKPTELGVPVLVFLQANGSVAHVQDMVPLETWGGRLLRYDRDAVYSVIEARLPN
jgi:thiol:disulfide interchange protein